MQRKVQEILRALNLEKKYSKEEILELYLNTIFLGQNCNGVKKPRRRFISEKTRPSSRWPNVPPLRALRRIRPITTLLLTPQHNKERQELILKEMLSQGMITKKDYDTAVNEKLSFKKQENEQSQASKQSYYVDQVITDVLSDLQEEKGYSKELATRLLYSGGLKIYAAIDVDIQAKMDAVFMDEKGFPGVKGKDGSLPQAAMVILDPYTGNVLAMCGGRGEKNGKPGVKPRDADNTFPGDHPSSRSPSMLRRLNTGL